MELTQEHFDQTISQLATKKDLATIENKLDNQTEELKTFAREQTDELARIIATTIAEPMEQHFTEVKSDLDIRKKVEVLEHKMLKLQEALHIAI